MSQINPFTGSILQAPQVQRQQSAEKDRQVRRAQDLAKNSALDSDRLEHQVESSEELTPIHAEQKQQRQFKRPRHTHEENVKPDETDGEEPHIDLTA
jgi:hypothetical protein